MIKKKKICVITGSRAEYGLLYWIMKKIQVDQSLQLLIIATGTHLSPEFGLTYKDIEKDGFSIDEKVEMLLSSDTPVGVTKSIGLGVIGLADALSRLNPDILVVLGDRFEMLAAAQAALIARIPIAHIAGGDTTEGAFDEAIRHSITKMSHIHFATNEMAVKRIRQMGENPAYIFNVGSPGIDYIKHIKLLNQKQLEQATGFKFRRKNVLVTFHPATLEESSSADQFGELLGALELLETDTGIIFTKTNADTDGRVINMMIDDFVSRQPNARAYVSLGQLKYLSMISQVDVVIGNSSSGLYEVPSFKKPTVNIGDRQKGRLQATSVINSMPKKQAIFNAMQTAFNMDCADVINPYGDGTSAKQIVEILKNYQDFRKLLKKRFFMLEPKSHE